MNLCRWRAIKRERTLLESGFSRVEFEKREMSSEGGGLGFEYAAMAWRSYLLAISSGSGKGSVVISSMTFPAALWGFR